MYLERANERLIVLLGERVKVLEEKLELLTQRVVGLEGFCEKIEKAQYADPARRNTEQYNNFVDEDDAPDTLTNPDYTADYED
jgi:hypothetical protein